VSGGESAARHEWAVLKPWLSGEESIPVNSGFNIMPFFASLFSYLIPEPIAIIPDCSQH
jgi:hypothetical protein